MLWGPWALPRSCPPAWGRTPCRFQAPELVLDDSPRSPSALCSEVDTICTTTSPEPQDVCRKLTGKTPVLEVTPQSRQTVTFCPSSRVATVKRLVAATAQTGSCRGERVSLRGCRRRRATAAIVARNVASVCVLWRLTGGRTLPYEFVRGRGLRGATRSCLLGDT